MCGVEPFPLQIQICMMYHSLICGETPLKNSFFVFPKSDTEMQQRPHGAWKEIAERTLSEKRRGIYIINNPTHTCLL